MQGQLVEGVVESVTRQGAVVKLLPDGPTGFLHISQVSRSYVKAMDAVFAPGEKIKVGHGALELLMHLH